ncbi:MAG: hypothetical protein R8L53_08735 [Mariprofundales bacterium]
MFLLFVMSLCCATAAMAGVRGGPELNRDLVMVQPDGDWAFWGQYDAFSPSLDLFGYGNKLSPTAAKLDKLSAYKFGTSYAINSRLHLRYQYSKSTLQVTRSREPKQLESLYTGHDLRLQYIFNQGDIYDIAIEAGYRSHKSDPTKMFIYETTIGGSNITVTPAPGKALLTITAEDKAKILALRASYYASHKLRLIVGVERRMVTIKANATTYDPWIRTIMINELPQATPWTEEHTIWNFGVDWLPIPRWNLALHLTRLSITRKDYIARRGKQDYYSTYQLDGYVFYHINHRFTLYAHGMANKHFVLGELPLAYNSRVNHQFQHPFGYVSLGLAIEY